MGDEPSDSKKGGKFWYEFSDYQFLEKGFSRIELLPFYCSIFGQNLQLSVDIRL
jgi:hypothetical protein